MTKGFPFRLGIRSANKQLPRLRKHADMDGKLIGGIAGGGPGTGTERNPELPLSVSITASRTTGAAPLAVFFEVVIEGTSAPTRTFHHCNVHWDYGDPSSGTWAYGNSFLNSRDEDYAPLGSHVFEGAGPYTVTCTVTAPDGETAQDTVVISPTAEDSAFPGAATVCITNGTDFTGKPTDAAELPSTVTLTNATFQAGLNLGYRRFLFKEGDTFDIQSLYLGKGVGYGAIMIGSWGSGAQPILRRTNAASASLFGLASTSESAGSGLSQAADDIRFVNLNLSNQTAAAAPIGNAIRGHGECRNILVFGCTFGQQTNAFQMQPDLVSTSKVSDPNVDKHDGLFFHGNVNVTAGAITPGTGRRISVKGNDLACTTGSHTLRQYHSQKYIIGHNRLGQGGSSQHQLKLSSHNYGTGFLPNGHWASENHEIGAIHDNEIIPSNNNFSVTLYRGNTSPLGDDERMREIVFERNWFHGGSNALSECVGVGGSEVTVRNNLVDFTGSGANTRIGVVITETDATQTITPHDIEVYSNSFFHNDTPSGDSICMQFRVSVDGATCTAQNNAYYAPNDGTPAVVDDDTTGAAVTKSNNGNAGNAWATNPYATNPPTAEAHFDAEVGTGNELIDAGVAVNGLFIDYTGATRPATPNQGAFE